MVRNGRQTGTTKLAQMFSLAADGTLKSMPLEGENQNVSGSGGVNLGSEAVANEDIFEDELLSLRR